MSTNANPTMFEAIPAVSELNRVPGFNPAKFVRKTKDGPKLDLKYKKLWFRLKYPAGRTKLTALKITEQLAIIEAKVFFDKDNPNACGSYIATKYVHETPGGLYIEAAQHEALDMALSDAGFGIQFSPARVTDVTSEKTPLQTEVQSAPAVEVTPVQANEVKSAPIMQISNVQEPVPMEIQSPITTAVNEISITEAKEHETTVAATEVAEVATTETAPVVELFAPAEIAVAPENSALAQTDVLASVMEETLPAYTPDMDVDDICAVMTVEEAGNIIVPLGTCKGMTLSQVADRRPASLRWYLNGYDGTDNALRAGAKIMLLTLEKAG